MLNDPSHSRVARRRASFLITLFVSSLAIPLMVIAQEPFDSKIEWIDGTTRKCTIKGFDADTIQLDCDGATIAYWDGIAHIKTKPGASEVAGKFSTTIYFAGGGYVRGAVTGGGDDHLVIDATYGTGISVPFAELAAIRFTHSDDPDARFDEVVAERLPGKDALLVSRDGDVHVVRGQVAELTDSGGVFMLGDRAIDFTSAKLVGIVFATGSGLRQAAPAIIETINGDALPAIPVKGTNGNFIFDTPINDSLTIASSDIVEIRCRSDRVVYLTTLRAQSDRTIGILNKSIATRFDRNAANGPLSLGGRVYVSGLGAHARSTVSYAIGGAYERFATTIGIDDGVRPRGSVVFRIEGDGRELFESNVLTGRDAPHNVTVDVSGINILTLSVNEADGLELSDHANWAGARLIRARTGG